MSCKLTKDILFDCDNPVQGGIEGYEYIMDFSAWRQAKIDGLITVDGVTNEISAIVLPPGGERAWKFSVSKASQIVATAPIRQVDGVDGFDHTVQTRVATVEQLDVEEISNMRFNKVVIIVVLSEGRARVYGDNIGLRLNEFDLNEGDAGTAGTIAFTAATDSRTAPEIDAPALVAKDVDLEALLTPTA
jgi:hypothetical protein